MLMTLITLDNEYAQQVPQEKPDQCTMIASAKRKLAACVAANDEHNAMYWRGALHVLESWIVD